MNRRHVQLGQRLVALLAGGFFWAAIAPITLASSKAAEPKRLLLAIGNDRYADSHWPSLRFASKDARDMARFFAKKAVPRFDSAALLASSGDPSAQPVTLAAITRQLSALAAANRSAEDIVIIYISGHGTIDWRPSRISRGSSGGELSGESSQEPKAQRQLARYIVTADTDSRNVAQTALPYHQLLAAFRQLKSRKKALILDFCHSGTGKSVLTPQIALDLASRKGGYFPPLSSSEVQGEYILAASNWRQSARESSRLQNGIYSHFLLKGFREDLNGDGAVSLLEAHSYARAETAKYTKLAQTPTAKVLLEGADPIWLKRAASANSYATLYSLVGDRFRLLVGGRDLGLVGKGSGQVIAAGRRRITLVHPETLKVHADTVFRFAGGKEYDVGDVSWPYARHRLTLGWYGRSYLSSQARSRYAPTIETGPALRYVHGGAFGLWDLLLSYSWLTAADTIAGIPQRRSSHNLALSLGWRERLGRLSLPVEPLLGRATASAMVSAGPSYHHLRFAASSAGVEQRHEVFGGNLRASLEVTFPRLGFSLGTQLDLSLSQSPFTGLTGPMLSGGGQVYIGAVLGRRFGSSIR